MLHYYLLPRLLLGGSHRLHRNGNSIGCARDFGLLPSQLAEIVQRGLIRGVKGIDFLADYQSVLSALLHAGTNAGCGGGGGEPSLHVLSAAHGIAKLSRQGLGAARSHARDDSQSGAQCPHPHPTLQHPQTRHKSPSCSTVILRRERLSRKAVCCFKHHEQRSELSAQVQVVALIASAHATAGSLSPSSRLRA